MTAKKKEQPNFEKALERLETIVREMEGGALSLEKMMSGFEEGQELIGLCNKKLNEVERKIEILVKKGDKVTTKPFGEAAAEEPDESEEEDAGGQEGELF